MKKVFPKEFSDLLNRKGLQILSRKTNIYNDNRIAVVPDIIKPEYVSIILQQLETLFPVLKNYHTPLPDDIIKKMKKNYSEKLGKSMKIKSSELNSRNSKVYRIATEIGLLEMLSSQSYKTIGEALLDAKFGCSIGKQIICYQSGDYVSPHNDHHPENENIKNGYYDIQLMFCNRQVKHQWLVYENKGFLNKMADITSSSGIAVYRLPFWHYTTPLIGKSQKENEAKRWLLLHSFEFSE